VRVILDSAADLIAEDGVEALTTSAVAKRSGISVGTLYQYFADREAVIATLVDSHLEAMNAQLAANFGELKRVDVRALVDVAIQTHVVFYRENPSFVKMWVHGRMSPAVVIRQRDRNHEMGKWLRAIADQFGLVHEDAPELGAWFAVEIGDRVLELAFRRNSDGDPQTIAEGTEMLTLYLQRFATEAGQTGVEIVTLPKLTSNGKS
jgi:AcrR family transcriptional regulator